MENVVSFWDSLKDPPPVSPIEHAELQQPQLLLGAGPERELPGSVHENGDRDPAAGQLHHGSAAQPESGEEKRLLLRAA